MKERIKLFKPTSPTQRKGQAYENYAKHYLRKQGLSLITTNYTCRSGENALIMRDGEVLVFIEVRYRSNKQYGSALDSVNAKKQRKIIQSAQSYLQKSPWAAKLNCRFDVLGITPTKKHSDSPNTKLEVNWIKAAFIS